LLEKRQGSDEGCGTGRCAAEAGCAIRRTNHTQADRRRRRTPGRDEAEGAIAPPLARPSFAEGEAAYKAKRYTDATTIFDRYTAEKPDNAWGHFMLGLSAWKGGDLAKSEKAFKAALAIDPDHLKSLMNLSRVLIEEKRFDDALDTLMRAGDIEPTSNEVQRLIGRASHALGKTMMRSRHIVTPSNWMRRTSGR
jgi:tetratricopeptide (TPR) repeat protein